MGAAAGQGSVARYGVTAASALGVVSLTPAEVAGAVGPDLGGGRAYLVGSLSSGLGNAGSDVDVHVLRTGLSAQVGPYMHFLGGVVVDVECFPEEWVGQVAGAVRDLPHARLPMGAVALDPPPRIAAGWSTVARWLHAVPVDDGGREVFTPEEGRGILPVLARTAYDELLTAVAVARLADRAAAAPQAREFLWRRASRQLQELRCRAAGDVTVNRKWLASRVRRFQLPDAGEARDEAGLRRSAERAGLPAADEWLLTRLEPADGLEPIRFAGRRRALNRHGRLVDAWSAGGTTAALVAEHGAARVLRALRRAELDVRADQDLTKEALTR
ncbi:hypothetical protein ACWERV_16835 [Streptomyces sp. NPDC004031]